MRLPRWLIVTLLSSSTLAVLGVGAWWWVMWPERTAYEFARLIATERWEDARKIIPPNSKSKADTVERLTAGWNFRILEYGPRHPLDILLCRRQFQIVAPRRERSLCGNAIAGLSDEEVEKLLTVQSAVRFTAERGVIDSFGIILDIENSGNIHIPDERYMHAEKSNTLNWASYRAGID